MSKQRAKGEARGRAGSGSRERICLGVVRTTAVGLQYYEARIKAGMLVQLEHEPKNLHDRNAIRVETADFVRAGHHPPSDRSLACPPGRRGEDRSGTISQRIDKNKEQGLKLFSGGF